MAIQKICFCHLRRQSMRAWSALVERNATDFGIDSSTLSLTEEETLSSVVSYAFSLYKNFK